VNSSHEKQYGWLEVTLLVLFTLIAVARIVSTYGVFCQTWDEPVHVASGMEWLQHGTYDYEVLHPPLARIAVAIGPFLSGIRLRDSDVNPELLVAGGNVVFAANGRYLHNLALARLGVLPFFLLAVWTVWYWARKLFGEAAAVAAFGLFTTLPPILGHAGLATTDMPLTATLALAVFAFTIWLERPTKGHTLICGMTLGLAILSKFSALLFLPACFAAVVLCWFFGNEETVASRRQQMIVRLKPLVLAVLICVVVILACYQFSFHHVTGPASRPHQFIDHFFGDHGRWHDNAYELAENAAVPIPEFFQGISQARGRVAEATDMYLLGQIRSTGWWYFFPVALGVKTPIAFLILTGIGAFGVSRIWRNRGHDWQVLVPLACAVALLIVSLPTKFNIGLRHILPIYPFLSIVAGFGIVQLWECERGRALGRIVAVGLAAWMLTSTAMAQPDYLAYFNEFAGKHPERILVDSDLDWGQDLLRLSADLRARGVTHVSIAYNGSADFSQMSLPPFEVLPPCAPTTGWVAISLLKLQMSKPSIGCGGYSWLTAYEPVTLVGKSIRLYWIPNNGAGAAAGPSDRDGGAGHTSAADEPNHQ
jgi:hypothetical protein